jgi:hypothetical protein
MLRVDAILPVALVLNLSAYGDWSNKGLVGHAMSAPAKTIPVELAVALAERRCPNPTVIAQWSRLFAYVVEKVLLYVAQFPLQIVVTVSVPTVTILMTDCGFLMTASRILMYFQWLGPRCSTISRARLKK